MEGSSTNVYPYRGYCCRRYTEPEGNLCRVPDVLENSQKCRVLWYNCHRTHRSVGYCGATVTELTRSIGYCGTAVTELTEVLCRVKTEGNYPRYRSAGTLQNLSVEYCFGEPRYGHQARHRHASVTPAPTLEYSTVYGLPIHL